ncbi:MAG: phenylalanine--tRNA ligase subunit beta [Bryobacterales bacterium]|nr:phenylalanine--tRNA ligase subunit beta [Bryobacterales bacterium]
MKFSTNWLSELIDGGVNVNAAELAQLITTKTAEQEGVEAVGAHFAQVRVVRVIEAEPIAGSHNQRARIDTGAGEVTLVCGAPNCRAGLLTAWVPPGTTLDGGRAIGVARVSGVESHGMLASGAELGINKDDDGVVELTGVAPGEPLPGLSPDHVIEIDNKSLTHRPDLWGHLGMAREVAAITGRRVLDPVDPARLPAAAPAPFNVEIADHTLCPRYSALVFENVTVGPSPLWVQHRLQSIGLNPINNIVDVTNLLLAELPQPTHAFDADKLQGATIFVRRALAGEQMKALNQETYTLDDQALVIADAAGPIAVAGVIGGLDSGVTQTTTRIVLESANFQASSVRKTSSRLKVRTDASMRFEKSQDPHNTTRALARAIALLEAVCPGIRLVGGLIDNSAVLRTPPAIELPLDWLRRKLGRAVEGAEVRAILEALAFGVTEAQPGVFTVTVPTWRATKDTSIKEDLVEEVGRMLGYSSIPPTAPAVPATPPPANPERDYFHRLRAIATQQGFHEVYNYSFVNEPQVRELGLDPADHVRVLNPIASDQDLLRSTLLTGILRNVRDNARHLDEGRFFEIGYEIHKRAGGELPDETPHLAAAVYSKAGDGTAGLLEAKRLAQCLAPGAEVQAAASARAFEHPRRAYDLVCRGETIGRIFEFHPKLVEVGRAAIADLNLAVLQRAGQPAIRYSPLRRFPASDFDVSVLTALRTTAGEIQAHIAAHTGPLFQGVEYVTQYQGSPLPADRKSVSFRVTIGSAAHTLSNDEITAARESLMAALRTAGYELRG